MQLHQSYFNIKMLSPRVKAQYLLLTINFQFFYSCLQTHPPYYHTSKQQHLLSDYLEQINEVGETCLLELELQQCHELSFQEQLFYSSVLEIPVVQLQVCRAHLRIRIPVGYNKSPQLYTSQSITCLKVQKRFYEGKANTIDSSQTNILYSSTHGPKLGYFTHDSTV